MKILYGIAAVLAGLAPAFLVYESDLGAGGGRIALAVLAFFVTAILVGVILNAASTISNMGLAANTATGLTIGYVFTSSQMEYHPLAGVLTMLFVTGALLVVHMIQRKYCQPVWSMPVYVIEGILWGVSVDMIILAILAISKKEEPDGDLFLLIPIMILIAIVIPLRKAQAKRAIADYQAAEQEYQEAVDTAIDSIQTLMEKIESDIEHIRNNGDSYSAIEQGMFQKSYTEYVEIKRKFMQNQYETYE